MDTIKKLNLRLFAADANINLTTSAGLSDEMKTYYEKRLLDNAEPLLVHDQFGDRYPLPNGEGKVIEWRRYSQLPKRLDTLTEGSTPVGQKLDVSTVTSQISQYGGWVQLSDLTELTAIDKNVEQATKLIGSQAGRTLDTITREVLCGGPYMNWAGYTSGTTYTASTSRADITSTCVLTPDMINQAQTELKAQNAQPFSDNCFVAIIHPYVAYDLRKSDEWIDAHKYARPEEIYNGEIGKLHGVRFVETTEAKVSGPGRIGGLTYERLTVKTSATLSTNANTTVAIKEALSAEEEDLVAAGVDIFVGGIPVKTVSATSGTAGSATITVGTVAATGTAAANSILCGAKGGRDGSAVFHTVFLAQNAYGITELEGGGLQHIIKQLGYGDDPLNQRSSVGWKATKAVKRLTEQYMYRWESGSAYSGSTLSN